MHDETYTFNQDSFSRTNRARADEHRLRQDDAEDKAKESGPRHRSRLRAELDSARGQRTLVLHGARPHERNYAVTPLLEHLLAGIQYTLGDLKADDSPSVKAGAGTKTAGK